MKRTDQQPPEPTPVPDDATATPAQLLDRAATDYATARASAATRQEQGGTGHRQGVLPGSAA